MPALPDALLSTRLSSSASSTPKFQDQVDLTSALGEHAVERLGLQDGAREAVEHRATGAVGLVIARADDVDHDLVGNKLALVEQRLAAQRPKGGVPALIAARSMSPVETCGSVRGLGEEAPGRLRALACPRRPEKNQIQRRDPLSFDFLMRPSYCCAMR